MINYVISELFMLKKEGQMTHKKSLISAGLIVFVVFISSCAGYFGGHAGSGSPAEAKPLAVAGGGYLSSDNHNEVTPFIYRDTNGQNPVLFYSSDKDGTYDIYYARMNADGTFELPVKMGTNVNTDTDDELFPVVYNNFRIVYLRYLRTNNSSNTIFENNVTNIDYFYVASDSFIRSETNFFGYTFEITENPYYDYVFYGNSNIGQDTLNLFNIQAPGNKKTWAGTVYRKNISNYSMEIWITEIENNGKRQLFYQEYARYDNGTNYVIISPTNKGVPLSYASLYNDRQPSVDWLDPAHEGCVYFSSDRRGTYDLYRYNIETISKLLDDYPFVEWLTNNGYTI